MKPTILLITLGAVLGLTLNAIGQQPPSASARAGNRLESQDYVNFSVSQVNITDLFCIMPADRLVDELKLVVSVDGITRKTLHKTVRKGSTWQFSPPLQYDFSQQVSLKLYELDQPQGEDFLGTVTIDPRQTSRGRQYFRGSGAEYLLQYNVISP